MNFNEHNNEQPCVPDAHGFSSLTVNSSQKRQEVEKMVFRERYFETGQNCTETHSKIISSHVTIQENTTNYNPDEVYSRDMKADACWNKEANQEKLNKDTIDKTQQSNSDSLGSMRTKIFVDL